MYFPNFESVVFIHSFFFNLRHFIHLLIFYFKRLASIPDLEQTSGLQEVRMRREDS